MADDFGDEVPEADALEQRHDVDEDGDEGAVGGADDSMEVPEADRLEQETEAGTDEPR